MGILYRSLPIFPLRYRYQYWYQTSPIRISLAKTTGRQQLEIILERHSRS